MLTSLNSTLLEHINFLIRTKSNPKTLLKNILKEYKVKNISDLSDKDGEELLCILDEETFHSYKFDELIENNPEKYIEIFKSAYLRVIAKKITISVYSVNENSIFQPLETIEKQSFLTILILEKTEHQSDSSYISKLKELTKSIKLQSWKNAIDIVEEYT